jgi:hypothetical protein
MRRWKQLTAKKKVEVPRIFQRHISFLIFFLRADTVSPITSGAASFTEPGADCAMTDENGAANFSGDIQRIVPSAAPVLPVESERGFRTLTPQPAAQEMVNEGKAFEDVSSENKSALSANAPTNGVGSNTNASGSGSSLPRELRNLDFANAGRAWADPSAVPVPDRRARARSIEAMQQPTVLPQSQPPHFPSGTESTNVPLASNLAVLAEDRTNVNGTAAVSPPLLATAVSTAPAQLAAATKSAPLPQPPGALPPAAAAGTAPAVPPAAPGVAASAVSGSAAAAPGTPATPAAPGIKVTRGRRRSSAACVAM